MPKSVTQTASGPHARANRRHRCRQHARHRVNPAIQRQLAKDKRAVHGIGRHRSNGDQQAKRNGKVVLRAFLHQIGSRQSGRDPLGRERQPNRGQRCTDPFTRVGESLVGKSDNGHRWRTVGDIDLYLDWNDVRTRVTPKNYEIFLKLCDGAGGQPRATRGPAGSPPNTCMWRCGTS